MMRSIFDPGFQFRVWFSAPFDNHVGVIEPKQTDASGTGVKVDGETQKPESDNLQFRIGLAN